MNAAESQSPRTCEPAPFQRCVRTGHAMQSSDCDSASDPHITITKLWMRLDEQQKREFLADVRVANPDLWLRMNSAALDVTNGLLTLCVIGLAVGAGKPASSAMPIFAAG